METTIMAKAGCVLALVALAGLGGCGGGGSGAADEPAAAAASTDVSKTAGNVASAPVAPVPVNAGAVQGETTSPAVPDPTTTSPAVGGEARCVFSYGGMLCGGGGR